jgi:hypothetical protein
MKTQLHLLTLDFSVLLGLNRRPTQDRSFGILHQDHYIKNAGKWGLIEKKNPRAGVFSASPARRRRMAGEAAEVITSGTGVVP